MDLLQLKYFQKVAELQHMTKAAQELHIAQSSLSRTISRLEEDLGVPLFERKGRQINLNMFGQLFLKRVDRVFSELEKGKEEIAELQGIENRRILVGTTVTRLLPELFKEFLKIHPEVKFQLFQFSTTEVQERIQQGAIDFCFSSPPIHQSGIVSVPIVTEEFFLAVSPNHYLANRSTVLLSDISEESFISLTMDYSFQKSLYNLCEQSGFKPKIMFESNDLEVIGKLVADGFGVAFMPAHWWEENKINLPVKVRIDSPYCQRVIGLSWKEECYLSNIAGDFREFVIQYFSR
ncbi:LysR family transcriptional regulator [Bacillus nitratireducens]|uniref:LysR family transcriptional regulator n=1 Tax=Bacillus nitratireducens TaxID=2026193 RepID=UPI001BA44E1F|nr:LysR family transcriptional regulator [Bacillus nitratireducens]QUG82492.1 LysR family transcriptional regulator [Bacillus nitratireducens]